MSNFSKKMLVERFKEVVMEKAFSPEKFDYEEYMYLKKSAKEKLDSYSFCELVIFEEDVLGSQFVEMNVLGTF
jgi:hypothetical protein